MPLAAVAIGAGTSILGGILGHHAASTAAQAQEAAAQKGMNVAGQNLQAATGMQGQLLTNTQQQFAPYTQAGAGGINALAAYLNPGGNGQPAGQLTQGWTTPFSAPTAAQAANTPGFGFQMQQGLNAIQGSAAAKGNLLTGGTMKAMNQYAQGLAATNYQQVYNNAFNEYLNNQNTFYQNQMNLYNRQMGLADLGARMAGQYGGIQQQAAQNYANIYGQNTSQMANLLGAYGTAQASGAIGGANAWQGALNNIGGLFGAYGLMKGLQGGGGGGGGGGLTAGDLSTANTIGAGLGNIGSFTGGGS